MLHLLRLVLLFNFLIVPALFAAGTPYDQLSDFQKDYWLKLLHYHQGRSRADGELFFMSKKGKTDPAAEMIATIDAFRSEGAKAGWFNYHPQCVFRERYHFLLNAGLLEGIAKKDCPEFTEWKKGLNADSLTLVFSSSYPNNPSSLFGHTLLRLNQKNKTSDLLDYSVAFSALPDAHDIGLVFAIKGLFGGYRGLLEVTKYYTKVNEYNNGESRDLIEYDLNISPDELERLINHLWEIYQTTYFDYFFTDENCSSVLADILAVPFNLDRVNAHARWYYLPSEMVKTIKKIPGRVTHEHFRPSLKKQLEQTLSRLSKVELLELREIYDIERELPLEFKDERVLDALISLLNYNRYRTKNNLSDSHEVLMRKALLRRSALTIEGEAPPKAQVLYDQSNSPDLGHEPKKFSIFTRTEGSHLLAGIEVKQGYHDLMSNDYGFDPFSQFDFLTGSLIIDKKLNRLTYDKITAVHLTSLHPYKFYDPQFSWSAYVLSDRIYDLDCKLCHRINTRGAMGPTIKPTPNMALSLLAGAFLEMGGPYKDHYRAGPVFEASGLFQLTKDLKLGLFNELRYDAAHTLRRDYYNTASAKLSTFLGTNDEIRMESSVVSAFGSFKPQTWVHQMSYGHNY